MVSAYSNVLETLRCNSVPYSALLPHPSHPVNNHARGTSSTTPCSFPSCTSRSIFACSSLPFWMSLRKVSDIYIIILVRATYKLILTGWIPGVSKMLSISSKLRFAVSGKIKYDSPS